MSAAAALLFPAPEWPTLPVEGGGRVPVARIFCVGRNYVAHASELGTRVDREAPFWFTKSPHALVEGGGTVPYPPGTEDCHHEVELVAVLGSGGFRVPAERAPGLVLGYACGLDMTRHDPQQAARAKGRPWDTGKDVEESAVVGPVVRAGRVGHPARGRIALRVNGETRQQADLTELAWTVPELIAHLSTLYHLRPGDLIFTGTPAGVGPVRPGDLLEGEVEGVGRVALRIAPRPEGDGA